MRTSPLARALPFAELNALRFSDWSSLCHPVTGKVADKVVVELIEADVDMGFALVDAAKAYHASGQPESSSRSLRDAEDIVAEIERRLHRLGDSGSGPFRPLLAELRNEIAAVERKPSI